MYHKNITSQPENRQMLDKQKLKQLESATVNREKMMKAQNKICYCQNTLYNSVICSHQFKICMEKKLIIFFLLCKCKFSYTQGILSYVSNYKKDLTQHFPQNMYSTQKSWFLKDEVGISSASQGSPTVLMGLNYYYFYK